MAKTDPKNKRIEALEDLVIVSIFIFVKKCCSTNKKIIYQKRKRL